MPINFLYENPDHWRERAKQMRTVAEGIEDRQARSIMLRIADDYGAANRYQSIPTE